MTETFHGYIDTTQDVLLVFEGCRRGLLPRVNRRLQEKERKLIQSGTVFVFDEQESGVKRWTDGMVWSPSRILGNFLIYRELEKRNGEKRLSTSDQRQRSYSVDISSTVAAAGGGPGFLSDRAKEKRLVGSLSDVYNFKPDGLIKKTMSIVVNGSTQHLISYYRPQDIVENKLRTPSSTPELTSLEISPELLVKRNFRIPPFVEPTFDHIGDPVTTGQTMHRHPNRHHAVSSTTTTNHSSSQRNRTTSPPSSMSSLRSMSAGSLNSLRQESFLYSNSSNNNSTDHRRSLHNGMPPNYEAYHHPTSPTEDNLGKPSRMYSLHIPTPPVYSSMPVSTPSPNNIRYDVMPPSPPTQQQYHHHQPVYSPIPPNPHLGHLLNPVHPLNEVSPSSSSTPTKLDQPLFYESRSLSTTPRLI
ncbi:hypothetical protein [Absidia glauca]|uniref:Gti1/Pac2 family protein n=1 Tax=Absidia glauca TaxID=4829 RepID=A0A163J9P0_ABSGL|nr:hypothetical protein [Absidia glauca]